MGKKKVDYLLTKNGANLGIIEAKSTEESYQEGIPQAKVCQATRY